MKALEDHEVAALWDLESLFRNDAAGNDTADLSAYYRLLDRDPPAVARLLLAPLGMTPENLT